jgi:predicted heme/steroid binding protein
MMMLGGIFMKKLLMVLFGVFVLTSCITESVEKEDEVMSEESMEDNSMEEEATDDMTEEMDELLLTLEELKEFNGKDGNKAYVAYEGIIYDVSEIDAWATGIHNGNSAGTDLTEVLKDAPHGISVLDKAIKIGKIKD